jgi:ABC-2 type transport system ATP-binding protein
MKVDQQLDPIVQWDGVSKRRGKRQALEAFSLAVAPGRVLGLIGPNGAGKTTAIELLLGMLRPDAGRPRAPRRVVARTRTARGPRRRTRTRVAAGRMIA